MGVSLVVVSYPMTDREAALVKELSEVKKTLAQSLEVNAALEKENTLLRACPESGFVARFRWGGDPTKPIPTGIPGDRPSIKWPEKDFPDAL